MKFTSLDRIPSLDEIISIESRLGITFPESLRDLFLTFNGGIPDPYVFRIDDLHTVVSETLPLISEQGRDTALESYESLVLRKHIVPTNFFPFAVDGGGDYFFVDCQESEATVYFYRSDGFFAPDDPLIKVCPTLTDFWDSLTSED